MLKSPPLTKKILEEYYVKEKLSTWSIEKKYGYSRSSVYTALKKFNIPTRSLAESHIKYKRQDFSGGKVEQAYMLGFAIGDLRVRRHNKAGSKTISIACGSTKSAQIKLIEDLFNPYGRVWVGKPDKRGAINIEAYVNKSFTFLLPDIRDYNWCAKKKNHFASFLAGFTDAEGSFYISCGKAFISWGNYDKQILNFIKTNLHQYDITTQSIYTDTLKGRRGTHGYKRNHNYSHLSVCKKTEVTKLVKILKPYLRHADKLERLANIEENIKLRNTYYGNQKK